MAWSDAARRAAAAARRLRVKGKGSRGYASTYYAVQASKMADRIGTRRAHENAYYWQQRAADKHERLKNTVMMYSHFNARERHAKKAGLR